MNVQQPRHRPDQAQSDKHRLQTVGLLAASSRYSKPFLGELYEESEKHHIHSHRFTTNSPT